MKPFLSILTIPVLVGLMLAYAFVSEQIREDLRGDRDRLGDKVLELEAQLPCGPTFELSCPVRDQDGASGIFVDGQEKQFRYTAGGEDWGVVHCYTKSGMEVRPE